MEYITIEISDIELEVLPLHELPGLKVIKVLSMPADMQRLKMSIDLLRLALRDPADWNGLVKYLSMGELIKVIDQWMERSQEESTRQNEEDEYYDELRREERAFEDDLYEERVAEEEFPYEDPNIESDPEALFDEFMKYFESDPDLNLPNPHAEEPDEDERF
jgi:hypothetical protein